MITNSFVSTLVCDYLKHADSIAAGVPGNDVLKKLSLSDTKLLSPPRLLVNAEVDTENKSASKIIFLVDLVITVDAGPNNRAQAETWMAAVRNRIRSGHADPTVRKDGCPFFTFSQWIVANRTEQQRTGWQIAKMRILPGDEAFESSDETKTYSISCPLHITVHI